MTVHELDKQGYQALIAAGPKFRPQTPGLTPTEGLSPNRHWLAFYRTTRD